jgi:predicted peptidase
MSLRVTRTSAKTVAWGAAILLLGLPRASAAATPIQAPLANAAAGQWQYRTLGEGFTYDVLLPYGYSPAHTYPVILYLHGVNAEAPAGTPPHNAFPQMMNSISVNGVNYRARYPAIIVAPQCAKSSVYKNDWGGTNVRLQNNKLANTPMPCSDNALTALAAVIATTYANTAKIYIVGFSLGGIGAYYLLATHPALFAAAIPVAGAIRGDVTPARFARLLRGKPIWAFHGFDDRIVPKSWDEALYDVFRRQNGRMKYTEFVKPPDSTKYPSVPEPLNGDGHPNADTSAFETPTTLDWLFAQSRSFSHVPSCRARFSVRLTHCTEYFRQEQ